MTHSVGTPDPKHGRKARTMSCCPFCHAEIEADTTAVRYYECGTRAERSDTVHYERRC